MSDIQMKANTAAESVAANRKSYNRFKTLSEKKGIVSQDGFHLKSKNRLATKNA